MRERKWKEKRPPKSMTAITLLLAVGMLVSWAASMYCLTIVTAQEFYGALLEKSYDFGEYASWNSQFSQRWNNPYYRDEHPDFLDHMILDAIYYSRYQSLSTSRFLGSKLKLLRDMRIPVETAVLFYDGDGNILHKSGDFIYFPYSTQEQWDAGEEEPWSQYGWIDLSEGDKTDYDVFYTAYEEVNSLFDFHILRITGVMDGAQIRPAALDCLTEDGWRKALDQAGPTKSEIYENGDQYTEYNYTLSDLDRAGFLEWKMQFDHTADVENKEELVTIYANYPTMFVYEGSPLSYQGKRYGSLLALTEELDFYHSDYQGWEVWNSEYELDRILRFRKQVFQDWTDYDSTVENAAEPEVEYVVVTAILSHPLQSAISALRNIYIGTGLLSLILILILRNAIKKRLTEPIIALVNGMGEDWQFVYTVDNKPNMWREAEELYERYTSECDWRRFSKNEMTRLQTALDYVKQAEQNRRQMTSSIAHELKTPLAIIHSYSEGLKEHIAEEKREQYLDVILSETERMDSMVLEMLDLSRLEAGKVKLARDKFSLSALARSVFDKFSALAEEKGLHIILELDGDCNVNADEARIGQVITNFASNAVRYTPEGGTVVVKTWYQRGAWNKRGETVFSVENTSQPLTEEELSKVWETFYQNDKSRGGKGTGLGLAIAKNIIGLHGGTCSVRNTDTGVEFEFTL